MADSKKFIQGSSYDLQEKWLNEIAPKYFKVSDLSMLRIGLFGYINEIMGNSLEDNYYFTNFLADETMLSLTKTAKFIYEYASRYNISDINANPAKVDTIMYIPLRSLFRCALTPIQERQNVSSGNIYHRGRQLQLSKNCMFYVDGKIPFMMDYPLNIQISCINDKIQKKDNEPFDYSIETTDLYSFSCRYDISDTNQLSDVTAPYLKCFKVTMNNEEYLAINITLRQVKRETKEFTVVSQNIVDMINFEMEYTDQLAGFNVWYYPSGEDKGTRLTTLYNGYNIKDEKDEFCYYKMSDNNELQIYFSGDASDFRPSYNSRLLIESFTTLGVLGNFDSYNNKNIEFQQPKNEVRNYQDNMLTIVMNVVGASTEGKDKLTLNEIKKLVQEEASTRDTIITEDNLNIFFNKIIEKYNESGSLIRFYKKVDDIIERIYSAFIIMYDNDKEVIPTNTVSIKLGNSNTTINLKRPDETNLSFSREEFSINIRPNTLFTVISGENNYKLKEDSYEMIESEGIKKKNYIAKDGDYRLIDVNGDGTVDPTEIEIDPIKSNYFYIFDKDLNSINSKLSQYTTFVTSEKMINLDDATKFSTSSSDNTTITLNDGKPISSYTLWEEVGTNKDGNRIIKKVGKDVIPTISDEVNEMNNGGTNQSYTEQEQVKEGGN